MSKKKKAKEPAAKQPAVVNASEEAAIVKADLSAPTDEICAVLSKKDLLWCVFLVAWGIFATTILSGRAAIISMLIFLLLSIRKVSFANAKEHLSLPMVCIFCMFLLYGISAIYSPFGETAVLEMFRGFAAFSVAGVVLLRFRKEYVPALLWVFIAVVTFYNFIALDMAASRMIAEPFMQLMAVLGTDASMIDPYPSRRLYGLLNNANVIAGMAALVMIICLYHLVTEKKRGLRVASAICLGMNAVVFWLCVSRGAMLCFGAAMVIYLVLTCKGERLRLFILMMICVVSTIVFATMADSFMSSAGGSILADVLALVNGPVILLLDGVLSQRMTAFFTQHRKAMLISGGALTIAVVVGLVFALTLSGSYTLGAGPLNRSVSLKGGESYTVSGDWSGEPNLVVEIEEKDDLLMDWSTVVYDGPLSEATFTLPEETATVNMIFTGDGAELRDVRLSDGTAVKLNLKLLPESIEGRLQDKIWTSSSLLLRLQYIKDAIKIWSTAPIFGRGLSSTDNLYTSVQPAYYMSKFVHCHVIQYLADMGLMGVICFAVIIAGLAWLMLRKWKAERDPLAAMLLTALFMMNFHSLMEINFSVRAYGVSAYLLLAIMAVAYGEPIFLKGKVAVKKATTAVVAMFWAVVVLFSGICISYRVVTYRAAEYETTNHAEYMKKLESFITFDLLDADYYKVMYIANSEGKPEYEEQIAEYAKELYNSGTFSNCDAVARYYFLPRGQIENLFASSMRGIAQKAADPEAWNGELDFYRARVMKAFEQDWGNAQQPFLEGVLSVRDYLLNYSQGRMQEIELSEDNQAFLAEVEAVYGDASLTPEEVYARLSQYSYAESEA